MAQETEIKLKISEPKAFLRKLKKLRARPAGSGTGRVHEMNVIFDTPQGTLAKHGQLLRVRTETPEPTARKGKRRPLTERPAKQRILLTLKQPASDSTHSGVPPSQQGHKVREELELEVAEAGTLTKIFEGLGMNGWFRYEKYRTTFGLPASSRWAKDLLIELDETPIGTFVELEGPAEAIDRAAQELGYSRSDYVLKSYLALYVESCRRQGQEPRDMLFVTRP